MLSGICKGRLQAACKAVSVKRPVKTVGHHAHRRAVPCIVGAALDDQIIVFVARHGDELIVDQVFTAAVADRRTAQTLVESRHAVIDHNSACPAAACAVFCAFALAVCFAKGVAHKENGFLVERVHDVYSFQICQNR